MKVSFLTLFYTLLAVSCLGQGAVFFASPSTYKFPKTEEGKVLEYSFHVKNKGAQPMIIHSAKVDCSCTEVDLPEGPIAPGEEGLIRMRFDTQGKAFHQDRIIQLETNTKRKTEQLRFKVFVIPKS